MIIPKKSHFCEAMNFGNSDYYMCRLLMILVVMALIGIHVEFLTLFHGTTKEVANIGQLLIAEETIRRSD